MKKITCFFIIVLVLILASCNLDIAKDLNKMLTSFDGLSLKRNEPMAVSYDEESAQIKVEISGSGYEYQWYESNADKSVTQKLDGKTDSFLDIPKLADGTLKYYFCEVSKGNKTEKTQLFMVANTGIPLLSVTTENNEPVLSKEKIDGDKLTLKVSDESIGKHKAYSFSYTKNNVESDNLQEVYLRGNFSYSGSWGKKSYNLKFKKGEKEKLIEYEGAKKSRNWVLSANANDHSFMKNWFATRMATVINLDGNKITEYRWTPQQEFVDFKLNGQYMGIYSLYEKIRFDDGRINVASIEDWDYTSPTDSVEKYGFILEAGMGLDGITFSPKRSNWGYALCDPDMDDADQDFIDAVVAREKEIIYEIEDALYDHDWEKFDKLVDLESLVDFFLVKEFVQEFDGYIRSVYMWWNPADQKLYFGPIWDCDNCAKSDPDLFYLTDRAWISELMQSPEFIKGVKSKWIEKSNLVKNIIDTEFDQVRDYIDVSVRLNGQRWANLVTYEQWRATSDEFLAWLKERYTWMDSALRGL